MVVMAVRTTVEDQLGYVDAQVYRDALARFVVPGTVFDLDYVDNTEFRITMKRDLGPCTRGKLTTGDGVVYLVVPIIVDPRATSPLGMIHLLARLWIESAIHEACENVRVDGEFWLDPHTQLGYDHFLEVRNLPIDQCFDPLAPQHPTFGDIFHSRGRWVGDAPRENEWERLT